MLRRPQPRKHGPFFLNRLAAPDRPTTCRTPVTSHAYLVQTSDTLALFMDSSLQALAHESALASHIFFGAGTLYTASPPGGGGQKREERRGGWNGGEVSDRSGHVAAGWAWKLHCRMAPSDYEFVCRPHRKPPHSTLPLSPLRGGG